MFKITHITNKLSRKHTLFFLMALMGLVSACNGSTTSNEEEVHYKLIAHRGGVVNYALPENSGSALEEAIARGYIAVETDVRFTKDSVPVVHHDKDFLKQFGSPLEVSSVNAAELVNIRNAKFDNHPLTLAEFAALTRGRIGLLIDIKGKGYPESYYQTVAEILKKNNIYAKSQVAWSKEARAFFSKTKDIKIGLNAAEMLALFQHHKDSLDPAVHFLIENSRKIDRMVIRQAREAKLNIIATINQWHYRNDADHLKAAKIDAEKMKGMGIDTFQIDAVYESFFNPKSPPD